MIYIYIYLQYIYIYLQYIYISLQYIYIYTHIYLPKVYCGDLLSISALHALCWDYIISFVLVQIKIRLTAFGIPPALWPLAYRPKARIVFEAGWRKRLVCRKRVRVE